MDIVSTLLKLSTRKIGVVVPNVVISEKHSDLLEITEHPVEKGAPVADHAFKRPAEVVMEVGFSGGGSLLDLLDTSSVGLSLGLSPKEVYQQLLDIQTSRVPFDVVTGKRKYSNMLIRELSVVTDKTTENVLSATLSLRHVIITSTQTTTVADKADMAQGVSTSAVQSAGTKSTAPVTNQSLLSKLASYF